MRPHLPASIPLERLADLWIGRKRAESKRLAHARSAVDHLTPVTVVTGGSRGLGLALAAEFARRGRDIALVARTEAEVTVAANRLARDTGRHVLALPLDLTHPETPRELDDWLAARGFYIDVLINNAGRGAAGPFADAAPTALEDMVALNVTALTRLCRHVLPGQRDRRSGGILNVASLGGAVPGPGQAAYYASKAYVLSLTEALASECAGEGVRISALAPGPLDTQFHADMGAEQDLYRRLLPAVALPRVARRAYLGWALGQRVIVPGVFNGLSYTALRLLPHPLSTPLVKFLLKRRR